MTGAELIAEGRRLSRPCVYLSDTGGEYAGIGRGAGPYSPPAGPYKHWISIDSRFLPGKSEIRGHLSVYLNVDDCHSGHVLVTPSAELPETQDGTKLYARSSASLPPLDAIFKFGSSEVRKWALDNGWAPEWGYNDNFKSREAADAYERVYRKELPLYSHEAHAMLGGWSMPWPDGDWELVRYELIVWTFADSEPCVEVWRDVTGYRVIQRIT